MTAAAKKLAAGFAGFALAVGAAGAALAAHGPFDDVPDDHSHAADIDVAVTRGWFTGYGDGTFKPDRNITPGQIAKVIERAYPDGLTRGETATLLRAGDEAVNAARAAAEAPECGPGRILSPAPAHCEMRYVVGRIAWVVQFGNPALTEAECKWASRSLCPDGRLYLLNLTARNDSDREDWPPLDSSFSIFADGIRTWSRTRHCGFDLGWPLAAVAPGRSLRGQICFLAPPGPGADDLVLKFNHYGGEGPAYRAISLP